MEEIVPIGKLKTDLYRIIDEAHKNNKELIITRKGIPVAKVNTIHQDDKQNIFGMMQDKAEIKGDIISSLDTQWEASK